METRKEMILTALDAFVRQRSGMDYRNYGDVASYRQEQRGITRDLHDYRQLARTVELRDSITADDLVKAFRDAFSGRLTLTEIPPGQPRVNGCTSDTSPYARAILDYCTGQYFPTEYRKAACAVMASALWASKRSDYAEDQIASGNHEKPYPCGDWLRASFRKEFARGIASRWFS
jgi:hypothetical protein